MNEWKKVVIAIIAAWAVGYGFGFGSLFLTIKHFGPDSRTIELQKTMDLLAEHNQDVFIKTMTAVERGSKRK